MRTSVKIINDAERWVTLVGFSPLCLIRSEYVFITLDVQTIAILAPDGSVCRCPRFNVFVVTKTCDALQKNNELSTLIKKHGRLVIGHTVLFQHLLLSIIYQFAFHSRKTALNDVLSGFNRRNRNWKWNWNWRMAFKSRLYVTVIAFHDNSNPIQIHVLFHLKFKSFQTN